jgi:hypothetical protein
MEKSESRNWSGAYYLNLISKDESLGRAMGKIKRLFEKILKENNVF